MRRDKQGDKQEPKGRTHRPMRKKQRVATRQDGFLSDETAQIGRKEKPDAKHSV